MDRQAGLVKSESGNKTRRLQVAAILAAAWACPSESSLAQSVIGHAADGPSWDDARGALVRRMPDGRSIAAAELVVSVRDWREVEEVIHRIDATGGTVVGGIPRLGLLHVRLKADSDEMAEAARYALLPGVKRARTNDVGEAACEGERTDEFVPNDPAFPLEWQVNNTGQGGGKPGADIELLPAWNLQIGDPSVVVAVIDSGTDFSHPEFQGRLLPGHDFVDEDADPTALGPHGIWVSSMIAANVNNQSGVCGVDRRCMILPIRVVFVTTGTLFDLVQGIDYATASGAQIINMSLQKYGYHTELIAALHAARQAGIILVSASGNGGNADKSWPGASPATISVGFTDHDDVKALSSDPGSALDFMAPGFNAVLAPQDYKVKNDDVDSGSSFAAPLVTGVISLMKAENPYLTQTQVYKLLMQGAEDQVGPVADDTPGWDSLYGHGRLNAHRTLAALCSATTRQPLMVSPPQLSVSTGGTWVCNIDAGPSCAGDPYLLLGSTSGTSPGFDLAQTHFPLNPDTYLHSCLSHPNAWPIAGNMGILDEQGRARATVTLPPGLSPAANMTVSHAFVVFDRHELRPLLAVPKFVSDAVAVHVGPVPQIVFKDAFESAALSWAVDDASASLWHVSADGECGSVGRMLAFTDPKDACDVASAGPVTSTVSSVPFVLSGTWPYTLSFDMIRSVDDVVDSTTIAIIDESGFVKPQVLEDIDFVTGKPGELVHVEIEVPNDSKLVGRTIHIELQATISESSHGGAGWLLDNIVVRNDGSTP
jgi:subtilisin family serine protease